MAKSFGKQLDNYVKEVQEYDEKGYIYLPDVISLKNIELYNEIIDELCETLEIGEDVFDESGSGKIKQIQYLHKKNKAFQELVDKLYPLARDLTKERELKVLNVQLFEKHPKLSKPTRSHQDNAYFHVQPAKAVTFWIPLDPITEENGALYYAPGTHKLPTRKHVRYHPHTTFRIRSGVPGLSLCLKEHPEELDHRVDAYPGDILAHHCNLIHRAGKNNTENKRRRAIGIVFIPERCSIDPRLRGYHNDRLREDIELQKVKDPKHYAKLCEEFSYLF